MLTLCDYYTEIEMNITDTKYYHLITNIGWNKKLEPIISLIDLQTNEEKTLPLSAYEFKFQTSPERFCTGYFDNKSYPCAYNNKVEGTHSQCYYCEKKQGFKSAFLFGGVANEIAERYLAQPHFIYLAYFYPDTIKVGTASEQRLDVRTVEQDALIYAFIAKLDSGFEVQKLEREISKKIGITEFVKSSIKLKNIEAKPDFERAKNHIFSIVDRINALVSDELKDNIFNKKDIKVVNFTDKVYYPLRKFTKIENSNFLVGKFLGLRGRYLLLENHENIVLFDKKYLVGRKIRNIEDYKYRISEDEQLGLF